MTTLLPRRIESSPMMPNASSAAVGRVHGSSALFMGVTNIGTSQNNSQDYSVLLEAGTYTLTVVYYKDGNLAIMDAQLDGVSIGTQDAYGVSSFNNVWSLTGITVATSGVKTLRFIGSTKNASSSAYVVGIQYWCLQRTDASTGTGTLDYTSRHIDVCPWIAWTETGATFARAQGSTALGGGWLSSTEASSDDGDSVSFYAALAAGTWSLTYVFIKNIICPKVDVFVGATKVVSQEDWYSNTTLNVVSTVSGISVATDGVYEIKFQANGKNINSSDFVMGLHWLTLQKTA